MGDAAVWWDIAAGLAGAALLVAAVPKIVAPEEIGAVFSALLSRLGAPAFRGGVAGRAVGVVEMAVGVWAVAGRGLGSAVAVVVLAAGFAVAGGLAVVSGGGLRCACFAGHARMLGWSQVVALPVWLVLAWGVASPAGWGGGGFAQRLVVLVLCCAAAAADAALRWFRVGRSVIV